MVAVVRSTTVWRCSWVVLSMVAGCGRVGFDPSGGGDDGGGLSPDVTIDLVSCAERGFVVQRASPGLYPSPAGPYVIAGIDEPRCTSRGVLVEEARVNYVWNAVGQGTGVDGLPSGWHSQHDPPVDAVGTPAPSTFIDGYTGVAIDVTNTAGSSEYYQVMLDVPITEGDADYTLSWFVRSDDVSGLAGCGLFVNYWTPGYTMQLGGDPWVDVPTPGASWSRVSRTIHVPAGTGEIQPFVGCDPRASGTFLLELLGPQLEKGVGATTPIRTAGAAVERADEELVIDGSGWRMESEATLAIELELDGGAPRSVYQITDAGGGVKAALYAAAGAWELESSTGRVVLPGRGIAGAHRIVARLGAVAGLAVDGDVIGGGQVRLPADARIRVSALGGAVAKVRYWARGLDDTDLAAASALP